MKRFLWWTFTVVAAISAALLFIYVIGWTYLVLSNPAWLTVRISTPVRSILPLVVYSILPAAWLIAWRRRRHNAAHR